MIIIININKGRSNTTKFKSIIKFIRFKKKDKKMKKNKMQINNEEYYH